MVGSVSQPLVPLRARFYTFSAPDQTRLWLSVRSETRTAQVDERRLKMEFEGYCVKCRKKRTIKNAKVEKTAKGRPMAKGACPVCGTTVTRFLSAKESGK